MKAIRFSYYSDLGNVYCIFFGRWFKCAWDSPPSSSVSLGEWRPGQPVWSAIFSSGVCEAKS